MTALPVIVFIHNVSHRNSTHYLSNMLQSLRYQTVPCNPIIVDTSNDGWYSRISDVCKKYNAIHLYAPEQSNIWNMSRAFNAGLKYTKNVHKSKYAMTTGMDFIFAPNFISEAIKNASENRLVLCRVHDLPKDVKKFDMKQFNRFLKKSTLHGQSGSGACQLASLDWFLSIGGYDERLKMWGTVDNDLVKRAHLDGKELRWLTNTSILNQWHPKYKNLIIAAKSQKKMNKRIFISSNSVKRNQGIDIGRISYSVHDWR